MILGVSHVTLLSKEIVKDGRELQKLGYSMSFVEKHVPNYKGKYNFLAHPSVYHSLSLYQHHAGIPIELIMYENFIEDLSPCYGALFDGDPPETLQGNLYGSTIDDELDALGRGLLPFFWDPFGAEIWFTGGASQGNGLKSLIVFVDVLKVAREFFENGLGYKPLRSGYISGRMWILESFRSPVKSWNLDIVLLEGSDRSRRATLDGIGFNCLALVTTNMKLDRLKLFSSGAAESTGEFELSMNNKDMIVEVFRGPDGEFIELLQVINVRKDD